MLKIATRQPPIKRAFLRYQSMQLEEDFIQHLAWYLLSNPGVKHVTAMVIKIACDRFSQQGYQPKTEYHTNYTREFLPTERLNHVKAETREELMSDAVDRVTDVSSPYTATLLHEVCQHINDDELVLLLSGQLDPADLARLRAEVPEDIIDLIPMFSANKDFLAEWVRQYAKS